MKKKSRDCVGTISGGFIGFLVLITCIKWAAVMIGIRVTNLAL